MLTHESLKSRIELGVGAYLSRRIELEGMMRMLHHIIAIFLLLGPSALALLVTSPRLRDDTLLRAQQPTETTASTRNEASTDPCPRYPRCDGAFRDKGCDGSGRVAGGVGAVIPWFPVKAYRPCPSFVAAKYKYDRSGQSLDEVLFARQRTRETDLQDLTQPPDAASGVEESTDVGVEDPAK